MRSWHRWFAPPRPSRAARPLVAASAAAVAAIGACASSPPPAPPPASASEAPASAPTATADVGKAAPATSAVAPHEAAKVVATGDVERCLHVEPKDLAAVITNEPDGGLCMNNAQTSADAGSTDRCGGMLDVMEAHRDAFRCCWDLWARAHEGAGAHVVLHVELAADGSIEAVSLSKTRSTVSAPELESCLVSVTHTLSFPRSPSGKETKVNYPFDFKARS